MFGPKIPKLHVVLKPRQRGLLVSLIAIQLLLSTGSLILSSYALDFGIRKDSIIELEETLLPFAEKQNLVYIYWFTFACMVVTSTALCAGFYLVFFLRWFMNTATYMPSPVTIGIVIAFRSWGVGTMCGALMLYDLAIAVPAILVDIFVLHTLIKFRIQAALQSSPGIELGSASKESSRTKAAEA